MSAQPEMVNPPSPHLLSASSDVLGKIVDPGVNLCVWQRDPSVEIRDEIAGLQPKQLRDVRCQTSTHNFDNDIRAVLHDGGLDASGFPHFLADLSRVAAPFFAVTEGREVKFRLLTTDQDDCRRFHVDYRYLRLLCTYQGPGTEWLTDAQADRDAYENGGSNEEIIRFGEPSRLEQFWVGILKDDAYPNNQGKGLVHRSPPVSGSGQTRVVFCLDAM
ncbi:MAG: DUF1826 domain-containing protein [Pseudomonadales bacterium]|nr:DUF1826 domain-containing protein [Pseudomonadales bacterium]MBO6594651.1 DUF1826 domain-containing protein [Pseudomonadales bacterium]MBO6821789.1 DUF1826 domain-containing protein [Pseudomonadales bacterium]